MHRKKRSFCNRCCETTSVRQMSLQPTTPGEQRTFVVILMTASFTLNQSLCIGFEEGCDDDSFLLFFDDNHPAPKMAFCWQDVFPVCASTE